MRKRYIVRWVGACVAVAALGVGCDTEGRQDPDGAVGTEGLRAVSIAELVTGLDGEHLRLVTGYVDAVPESLPQHAVAVGAFIEGAESGRLPLPTDGRIRVRVLTVNAGDADRLINLICLVDGGQVPCAQDADVYEFTLPPGHGAAAPLDAPAQAGSRLDVLLFVDEDLHRPLPTARRLASHVGEPGRLPATVEAPEHLPTFGGCGFVTPVEDLTPTETFTRPRVVPRGTRLWAVGQVCTGDEAGPYRLLAIANRSIALSSDDPLWSQPFGISGEAFAVELPPVVDPETTEIHLVLLRLGSLQPPSWVSHPVVLD